MSSKLDLIAPVQPAPSKRRRHGSPARAISPLPAHATLRTRRATSKAARRATVASVPASKPSVSASTASSAAGHQRSQVHDPARTWARSARCAARHPAAPATAASSPRARAASYAVLAAAAMIVITKAMMCQVGRGQRRTRARARRRAGRGAGATRPPPGWSRPAVFSLVPGAALFAIAAQLMSGSAAPNLGAITLVNHIRARPATNCKDDPRPNSRQATASSRATRAAQRRARTTSALRIRRKIATTGASPWRYASL
jgi:hypothetical protein